MKSRYEERVARCLSDGTCYDCGSKNAIVAPGRKVPICAPCRDIRKKKGENIRNRYRREHWIAINKPTWNKNRMDEAPATVRKWHKKRVRKILSNGSAAEGTVVGASTDKPYDLIVEWDHRSSKSYESRKNLKIIK